MINLMYGNAAPSREIAIFWSEVPSINLVHTREIRHIDKEDCGLDAVREGKAIGLSNILKIFDRLVWLRRSLVRDEFVCLNVLSNLTRGVPVCSSILRAHDLTDAEEPNDWSDVRKMHHHTET